MHKEYLMGNEAIAIGALAAGVNFVAGYPGTPSTEVLETVAKRNPGNVYVEWSVNEKAAMEAAAGAAYAGARALVTMKQVGLNVAADPLMSLEYIGIKGGMVVMVADDPGPISSQTEQDTRTFAAFSKVPVFDPSSVKEAFSIMKEAFDFSEKWGTPVIFRTTTRIDHGYESIDIPDENEYEKHEAEGFVKDASRFVIFPKLSVKNHALIEQRNTKLSKVFSEDPLNFILPETDSRYKSRAVATHGINYTYVTDVFDNGKHPEILRIATPFPFPEELAAEFLRDKEEVLCVEELDPVIEKALIGVCGKYGLSVRIRGKLTGDIAPSGENSVDSAADALADFLNDDTLRCKARELKDVPDLPIRPPVLCAGCPHRASFYAVKEAMKGQKTFYGGDIGCYTLGNAEPLEMCDTCLCMGAGINIAQGIWRVEPDTKCFAFVGDSTFFASGITGVINAFYNQAQLTVIVLDNSTTAMTGHQPHPGTGRTVMGQAVEKVSIEKVLRAIGLSFVETVDPLDLPKAIDTIRRAQKADGVKAVIFRSPCIAIERSDRKAYVDKDTCIGCRKCINELGCPAMILDGGKAKTLFLTCTGCMLCEKVCPVGAIRDEA